MRVSKRQLRRIIREGWADEMVTNAEEKVRIGIDDLFTAHMEVYLEDGADNEKATQWAEEEVLNYVNGLIKLAKSYQRDEGY